MIHAGIRRAGGKLGGHVLGSRLALGVVAVMTVGLVAVPSGTARGSGAPTVIYVANNGTNTVTAYDTSTNAAVAIPVGQAPYHLAITPDGASVYAANSGSNSVSVISTATNTVTATIPVGAVPLSVAITPDGATAYVTNLADGTLSVISTATNSVTATINVAPDPSGVAITPDGATLYVTSERDGSVSVISTATNTVTATIPGVSLEAFDLAITPDGTAAYVANIGSNSVSVISTAANSVTASIPVSNSPAGVAISPDGSNAYVASVSGVVSVISTTSNTVTATVASGTGTDGVAIAPDGSTVYAANSNDNTIAVISTSTNTVTKLLTGFDSPLGIAVLTSQAPAVTGLSPASGPVSGGTAVTITGSGFHGATSVDFGTAPAASFTVTSDTSITATAPPASIGQIDLTVTTPSGTSVTSSADRYSYLYPFTGFQSPVASPPTLNVVHAGQAIAITFSLGGDHGLNILAAGYPAAQQVNCSDDVPVNTATETDTAGGSGLQFEPGTNNYAYVWKTAKAFINTCQVFTLGLDDGTTYTADFEFSH